MIIPLFGLATAAFCLVAAGSLIGLLITLLREYPLWLLLVLGGAVLIMASAA